MVVDHNEQLPIEDEPNQMEYFFDNTEDEVESSSED